MKVGGVYTITMGKYSCKYLCTFDGPAGSDLKRVMLPKTKADGIRFPVTMTINPPMITTKNHQP